MELDPGVSRFTLFSSFAPVQVLGCDHAGPKGLGAHEAGAGSPGRDDGLHSRRSSTIAAKTASRSTSNSGPSSKMSSCWTRTGTTSTSCVAAEVCFGLPGSSSRARGRTTMARGPSPTSLGVRRRDRGERSTSALYLVPSSTVVYRRRTVVVPSSYRRLSRALVIARHRASSRVIAPPWALPVMAAPFAPSTQAPSTQAQSQTSRLSQRTSSTRTSDPTLGYVWPCASTLSMRVIATDSSTPPEPRIGCASPYPGASLTSVPKS